MRDSDRLNYGNNFVESVEIPAAQLDRLFVILFSTLFCSLVIGNLLFRDWDILRAAVRVAAICTGFVGIFYCVSRIFKSLVWGLVCLYGAVLGVVYARSPFASALFYVLAGAACVYTLRSIKLHKADLGCGLVCGLIGAVTTLGARGASTSFDILQRAMTGGLHYDVWYHASVASMIKNYGVTSTGLNGLVETPYHVLSHQLMAAISSLSGVSVLETYGMATHLFLIPMLMFSIVAFAISLNREKTLNLVFLWSMTCFMLVGIPYFFEMNFGVFQRYIASESYAVSLSFLLLGMTLLYKRALTRAEMLVICFFGVLCVSAKLSVGLIYMGLWWIRCLFFSQTGTAKILLTTAALSVVTFWVGLAMLETGVGLQQFGPFPYVERFSFWGNYIRNFNRIYLDTGMVHWGYLLRALVSIGLFIAIHFLVSWVAIGQSIYKERLVALRRSPVALYSLGAAGVGLLLIAVMTNTAVIYFSHVSFFVSLPTVLLLGYSAIMSIRLDSTSRNVLVPFIAFVVIMMGNYAPMSYRVQDHARFRNNTNAFVEALVDIRNHGALDQCLSPTAELIAQNPVTAFMARPFIYPAVSERPWVNVVPENTSTLQYEGYSYEYYGITPKQQFITMPPVLKINKQRSLKIVTSADFIRSTP